MRERQEERGTLKRRKVQNKVKKESRDWRKRRRTRIKEKFRYKKRDQLHVAEREEGRKEEERIRDG